MSHPLASPRSQATARPDRAALLLEAVRLRDGQATAHLVRQWVHRCGPMSLDRYLHQIVAPQAGAEAAAWLEAQINRPLNLSPERPERQPLITPAEVVESAVVDTGGANLVGLEATPAQEHTVSMGPSPAVGAPESAPIVAGQDQPSRKPAFDFDPWTSFPDPALLSQPAEHHADAAVHADAEHHADAAASVPLQALVIEPTRRQSWDFGSARIEAEPIDSRDLSTDFDLTDLGPTDPGTPTSSPGSMAGALEPLAQEPLEQQQDRGTGFVSAPLKTWTALRSSSPVSKGLRAFSRVKALMRDCLDEAIVGLQPPGPSHGETVEQSEPPAVDPQQEARIELPAAGLIPPIGPRLDSTSAEPPRASSTARFRANQLPTLAGTLPTTAALPAPTPEALADLRAWLPQSQDSGDFPKAS